MLTALLSIWIVLALLPRSSSKPPPALSSQRHPVLRALEETSDESGETSLDRRLQHFIKEQPLISMQLVSTLYAYASILLTGIVKLPSPTRTLVRLQCGIAIAASRWIGLISKIQHSDLPAEIANEPMTLKQYLSAAVASRVGQVFILSCLSLVLAGDKYSVLPLLLRGLPELLQFLVLSLRLTAPSFEISPHIIDAIFESQNTSAINEMTNSTTNFNLSNTNPGVIHACCDIIALPIEISLLPKSIAKLRSKNFTVILLNMCFLYVFLHYLSKRVAEIRFTVGSIPENLGRIALSSLKQSELLRGLRSGKEEPKRKTKSKKKRKQAS